MAHRDAAHPRPDDGRPLRNVYACLVHEQQDCVIDLVRNLRYHDSSSTILLYNGGTDPDLFNTAFPFERHGAVMHPSPRPRHWGYLHGFALDCMQYALAHLEFDVLTIVDSDQLATRSGFCECIGDYLRGKPAVGQLVNSPFRHPRSSKLATAVRAWREIDLWRPLLQRFPGGEEKFVYATFWPTTVFTRDAARELTRLAATDRMLQDILGRTRAWATEEVVLPTLVALLGFEIHRSPCSYDFVRPRRGYTPLQIAAALRRKDVYWLHPIPRRYDDAHRVRLRAVSDDYAGVEWNRAPALSASAATEAAGAASESGDARIDARPALPKAAILQKMRRVEGWLADEEADLLITATSRAVVELPSSDAVVEIGSYCGRATVVLASVIRALAPSSRVYSIDPHDGKVGAIDTGIRQMPPTLAKLKRNLAAAGVGDVVRIMQGRAPEIDWNRPVGMLLIDGLHDYESVASDFCRFEPWIVPGGYVAFHDYARYFPGVVKWVDELLRRTDYRRVRLCKSMMLVQRIGPLLPVDGLAWSPAAIVPPPP